MSDSAPFTRIPNNVQDASFKVKLSGTQHRILEAVKRKTYGFHVSKAELSLNYLADMIDAERKNIARALDELESRKILFQEIRHGKSRFIWINENTEEWVLTVGEDTHSRKRTVGEITHSSVGEDTYSTVGEITHKVKKGLKKDLKESTTTARQTNEADFQLERYAYLRSGEDTISSVHTKVFNRNMMDGLMSEYVRKLLEQGRSEEYVKELILETGESATNPSLRYMQAIEKRWDKEGISSREESKAKKPAGAAITGKQYQSKQAKTQEFLRKSIDQDHSTRIDITELVNTSGGGN